MTKRAVHIRRWPEGAVVYHIYPRSFQDSNGDGVGDLPGITGRLDYLVELGVQALWLSPFYPSPMADFGYDIADYCGVDPIFGTLNDFKELLRETHKRGIKLVVDLVPNHTSDEHPWFVASRTSNRGRYSDWYIWRDAHPESEKGVPRPPNNWRDELSGGSAWEWDETRGQFYLHSFDRKQPDLNWANPEVRAAIKDVMRFWLDLGVDGFRVDAVYWMAKDPLLRDDDYNPDYIEGEMRRTNALMHNNSYGWPAIYAYLYEMAQVLKEEPYKERHRFMVTEAYPRGHDSVAAYMGFYEGIDPEVAAPFNFEGLVMGWTATGWRRFLRGFHLALEMHSPLCVASYAFGNHDQRRVATRFGYRAARAAALMQLSLPGMAFIYYGDEIGMEDVSIPAGRLHDPQARDDPRHSRDPARTPMQWDNGKHAGFSTADRTWLPLSPDAVAVNVSAQRGDPESLFTLYTRLAHLRASSDALRYGGIQVLELGHPDLLGFVRSDQRQHYVVLVNFSDKTVACVPGVKLTKLVISSEPATKLVDSPKRQVELLPYEGALFLQ